LYYKNINTIFNCKYKLILDSNLYYTIFVFILFSFWVLRTPPEFCALYGGQVQLEWRTLYWCP